MKSIHARDGTVVQLIGDAILAVWNAPVEQEDYRSRACLAAVELNQQLITFDASQAKLPMRTRVGIHTGKATVGNLGSQKRFDFATIGDRAEREVSAEVTEADLHLIAREELRSRLGQSHTKMMTDSAQSLSGLKSVF